MDNKLRQLVAPVQHQGIPSDVLGAPPEETVASHDKC